jgi:uncharacterized protein (DUF433 family)
MRYRDTIMDWSGCEIVETVLGKVSGVPVIKGTRVPADTVLENYEAGESVEDIAYNFDLRPEEIQKLLEFAAPHHALSPRT